MESQRRVLALVSEPSEFARLSRQLENAGITVTHAATLEDALTSHAMAPADAIVCDADFTDWRRALNSFRHLRRPASVVLLSRLADERLWLDVLEAGAFDLLEKSASDRQTCWVVGNAMDRPTRRPTAA